MALAAPLLMALGAALGGDYRVDSGDWNGLSALAGEAARFGCPIEPRDTLAWDELGGHDVLWLLYPRHEIDPRRLGEFIAAGGRVVIGDDHGAATAALARLGLRRQLESFGASRHFNDNPNLPLATSTARTPLGSSTEWLVTNHPACFVDRAAGAALQATFEFAPGRSVVVEGALGRGRFIALADPSVLINNMQEIEADRHFALALVAATCRPAVDRILLFSGDFDERGEPMATLAGAPPPQGAGASGGRARANALLGGIGQALAELATPQFDAVALAGLGCALAALSLLLHGRALPAPSSAYNGSWIRVGPASGDPVRRGPLERAVAAALLREEVWHRLDDALGGGGRRDPRAVIAALGEKFGEPARRAAATLFAGLPAPAADGTARRSPAARQLARWHRDASAVFDHLDDAAAGSPPHGAEAALVRHVR